MAKLIAGHQVRRVRRAAGLNQAMMAEQLGISASYLNLIERNQRPLTAQVLVRLTELFDFDPRSLNAAAPGGGADAIRRRLGDPMFADLEIDRAELEELRPRQMTTRSRLSGARSSAGATTSPISTPRRKRWPTSCGCRPGTCTPRSPSGCG
jgi:transcriptional regulator with XRE-family HTH domain